MAAEDTAHRTIEERVERELARMRPEFTKNEWITLRDVIANALLRLARDVEAASKRSAS